MEHYKIDRFENKVQHIHHITHKFEDKLEEQIQDGKVSFVFPSLYLDASMQLFVASYVCVMRIFC